MIIYLYYGKLLFLWLFPETSIFVAKGIFTHFMDEPEVWFKSYFLVTLSIASIAGSILLYVSCLSIFGHTNITDKESRFLQQISIFYDRYRNVLYIFIGISFVCMIEILMIYFKIGRMGIHNIVLPFRLNGFIYYSHKIIVPVTGLVFLSLFKISKKYRYLITSILIFGLYLIIEIFIRSSRSSLLFVSLWISFLIFMTTNNGLKGTLKVFVVIIAIGLISFPYITAYRYSKKLDVPFQTVYSNYKVSIEESEYNYYIALLLKIFYRFTGAEGLLIIVGSGQDSVASFLPSEKSLVDYYTHDIVQDPEDKIISRSPGLLAGLYMAGGEVGIFIGCLTITMFFLFTFLIGEHRKFRLGKIYQVFMISILFHLLIGGWMKFHIKIIFFATTFIFAEIIIRLQFNFLIDNSKNEIIA
jgi:hypothetical protein